MIVIEIHRDYREHKADHARSRHLHREFVYDASPGRLCAGAAPVAADPGDGEPGAQGYPPDYVEVLIETIERYDRRAVVGVHGVTLPPDAGRYFSRERAVLHFARQLENDTAVNVLGTGTLAFHSSTVRGLSLEDFPHTGMADICFAAFCRARNIPLVAVARRDKWLKEIPTPNISLYQEFRNADTLQSDLVQRYRPWGKQAIDQAIKRVLQEPGISASSRAEFGALRQFF